MTANTATVERFHDPAYTKRLFRFHGGKIEAAPAAKFQAAFAANSF
jgi:hypothetical protein